MHFPDPVVRQMVELDITVIEHRDGQLRVLEQDLAMKAKAHDAFTYHLLRSVPGIGRILSLVILYEIEDVGRFPTLGQFASYARLVKCAKESAGKKSGYSDKKIGNAYLKWAFSEAAVLFLRGNPEAQKAIARLASKHGKGKPPVVWALAVMADYENSDYLVVYDTVKDREWESSNETPMNILSDDSVALRGLTHTFYCGVDFRATFGPKARALTFIEFYCAI